MADCKVRRRVVDTGFNGKESNSRMLDTMSCTPAHTAHLSASTLGHSPYASSWLLFDWPGCGELPGFVPHCSHV